MKCIDVTLNDAPLCRAGMPHASMVSAHIGAQVNGESLADLILSGMIDDTSNEERAAHVYWIDDKPLSAGDRLTIRFLDSDVATPPHETTWTDSPEYLEEQRKFAEFEKTFTPDREPAPRPNAGLRLEFSINDSRSAVASLQHAEEHILCSITWDKWRPERCRVFVRSFGDKSKPDDTPATEWLRANLALGDVIEVRVAA